MYIGGISTALKSVLQSKSSVSPVKTFSSYTSARAPTTPVKTSVRHIGSASVSASPRKGGGYVDTIGDERYSSVKRVNQATFNATLRKVRGSGGSSVKPDPTKTIAPERTGGSVIARVAETAAALAPSAIEAAIALKQAEAANAPISFAPQYQTSGAYPEGSYVPGEIPVSSPAIVPPIVSSTAVPGSAGGGEGTSTIFPQLPPLNVGGINLTPILLIGGALALAFGLTGGKSSNRGGSRRVSKPK